MHRMLLVGLLIPILIACGGGQDPLKPPPTATPAPTATAQPATGTPRPAAPPAEPTRVPPTPGPSFDIQSCASMRNIDLQESVRQGKCVPSLPSPAEPTKPAQPATETPRPAAPVAPTPQTPQRSTEPFTGSGPDYCVELARRMGYNSSKKPNPTQDGNGNYIKDSCVMREADETDPPGWNIVVPSNLVAHVWLDENGKKKAVTVVGPAIFGSQFLASRVTVYQKAAAAYKGFEGKWTVSQLPGGDNGNDCIWVSTSESPQGVFANSCSEQKRLMGR